MVIISVTYLFCQVFLFYTELVFLFYTDLVFYFTQSWYYLHKKRLRSTLRRFVKIYHCKTYCLNSNPYYRIEHASIIGLGMLPHSTLYPVSHVLPHRPVGPKDHNRWASPLPSDSHSLLLSYIHMEAVDRSPPSEEGT